MTTTLGVGFVPLVDAAPLIVAQERGFASQHGLSLRLHRSNSWAALRDRISAGLDQCAHMLAPIPIASQVGYGNPKAPMIVPMGLSANGNGISVSNEVFKALHDHGWTQDDIRDPMQTSKAFASLVHARKKQGEAPYTLASVYPLSSHAYELRYWLAAGGLNPDQDVNLTIVPPPQIVTAVQEGHIDGYCVGAPWNLVGSESGASHLIATKADIWPHGPEKVLAVHEGWAEANPQTLKSLVSMLVDATRWCADEANHSALAQTLSGDHYLGGDSKLIARSLSGQVIHGSDESVEDYLTFDPTIAAYPHPAHALWFYSQMVRWGQLTASQERQEKAKNTYKPDIYRNFGGFGDGALPPSQSEPRWLSQDGGFSLFDGIVFNPDDISGYLNALGAKES